ncbi:hypothetical protein Ae201684_006545 [Aphanomyces euteiches]|uniref:Fibronectin type-III domain-containing protein n=1 Tax=Aphanomyces euteiches TaxID=100861 RepID=A0A6G0XBD1_9STRA|nr:hypothetical protein Ae201684_006545 [Aphanomyces euteiches]
MTRFRWIFWLCALPWALGATTLSVSRKEGIATGQVDVLQGLPGALALSYYLTGAGDLHYAVVLHGHNALTAQDIKDAAIQSAATLSTEAGTFTSKSATRLAWNVLDLAPNTTYDVYFVAEASNSNGVFGTVVSVNGTTTHPHAPRLSLQRSGPVRASSSTAEFVVNCSSPGLLHYIIVPTRASQNLSATDIWTSNQTLSLSIPSTNAVQVNVTDLAPFTTYDVWMVTEVKGSDGVLGRVLHAPEAFTTHAVAPDVVNLGCVPRGGTTSELLVGLRLEFPALAFVNYNVQSALRAVEYALFYLATTEGSLEPSLNTPEAIQNATNTTTRHASQLQLSFPAREVNNVAVVAATDTTVDIHANITALKAGTNYSLAIVVETKGSHGLFGRIGTISGCQTHAPAPIAKSIEVAALPKTTNMALLRVSVESAANVHYVVGEPNAFQKVVDHKNALATYVAANESFQVGSIQNVPSNEWTNVTLTNLNASTMYSVVVFTETVDSFGVFGLPSSKTDFKTNEPAGSVAILEAAPVKGSTTQVSISVKPSDPRNIVSMCWKEAAPTAFTCGNHTSVLSNLTEDTIYEMYVVAETAQGVVGVPSEIVTVSTHALPPTELALNLSRIGGRFDLLAATITTTKPCWLHVALLAAENITKTRDTILQNQTTMHYYNVTHSDNGSTALMFDNLQPNATYTLAVFPESLSVNGTGSQVYGALETINATTYAAAPTVLQSAALPLNATVDKILLVVNLTTPGRLHYMITDRDLHDPNVLRTTNPSFYVRRGHFDVVDQVWTTVNETKGGVNVSVPLALPIFEGNHTIDDTLEPDTMYHVFVTTETFDSFGVFGALPAPLLATTHAPPPTFTTLSILPTPWKATSIDLNLTLSRYGLVQYILMLRNPGSAFAFNASNETINISQLDSSILTAGHIQRASLEELGEGVMLNGSLTVSREDWSKQTQTHKAFTNLISGATYELCIVAETDASYGVFGPVSCHVVTTFVDYTNATSAQDEWFVEPVDGTTDQVVLTWHRRSEAPIRPYFVLVKGSAPPSLGANGFSRTTFSEIIPGQHGIVAAGELPSVATNPTTHQIVIEQLAPHTPYFAFFSGETLGSHGVFTDVKGPISTMTHAPPPVLNSYAARPADGNTTGFQLVLELACDKSAQSCNGALIHAVVTLPKCPPPMPLHLAHSCVLVYKRDNVTLPSNTPLKDYKIFLQDDARLKPNTSYAVHLATETINSHGVLSPWTSIATATHPMPPSFVDIQVRPKHASTTELELAFELSTTGLVHYMIAEDTKHVEVLSPYNVSSKKKNGEDWHKYPHQSISYRRTITVTSPKPQIEVLNYLSADTSYTVWVLAETLVDADLYTQILVFANVSTFAPAPLLLAHQAGPTPASTTELRLDYKLNTLQGLVHCMVAMSTRWTPTLAGPAVFGNRIGFDTKVVGQVTINATSSEGSVDIPVPHPDTSYTIYLVTETFNSHGVFGVVAQLDHIKSSAHAPAIINSTVVAADARTDALSVRLELSSPGIVHYSVVEKNHPLNGKEASSIISNTSSVVFLIDGLRESTWYDVYIQTETIGSRGVLGALVKVPSLTPTHGPPPVVLEEVDCTGAPNCELLGREPCWLVSATCGECREGYVGDDGPANTQCTVGAKKKGLERKKTIGIKISGVKQATPVETEVQPSGAAYEPCPDHSSFSLTLNRCECAEGYAMQHNSCVLLCPPNSSPSSPGKCQCDPGFVLDSLQTACVLRGPGSGPIGGVNAIS